MPTTPVRNPERVLASLGDLSEAVRPLDLRVGQAIANALLTEFGPEAELARLYYVEDDTLADVIVKYVVGLRATSQR